MTLSLRKWQEQFLELIENEIYREALRERKVMVILDRVGGAGKSKFMKWLATNEKETGIKVVKLPFDRPDRINSAMLQLTKNQDVDMILFDCTRTLGEETSMKNLFEVVEEIKNGYVVDMLHFHSLNHPLAFPDIFLVCTMVILHPNQFSPFTSKMHQRSYEITFFFISSFNVWFVNMITNLGSHKIRRCFP